MTLKFLVEAGDLVLAPAPGMNQPLREYRYVGMVPLEDPRLHQVEIYDGFGQGQRFAFEEEELLTPRDLRFIAIAAWEHSEMIGCYLCTAATTGGGGWDDVAVAEQATFVYHTKSHLLGRSAHEVHTEWVTERLRDGWHYAAHLSNTDRKHPMILPYESLPEEAKLAFELAESYTRFLHKTFYQARRAARQAPILEEIRKTPEHNKDPHG